MGVAVCDAFLAIKVSVAEGGILKRVCPYCLSRLRASAMAFRCVNPRPCLKPAKTKQVGVSSADSRPLSFVPRWKQVEWLLGRRVKCSCGYPTTVEVCPRCDHDWPRNLEDTDNFIIAIVGAQGAGKSHYLAVLIHELMHRVAARFHASLGAADDQTRDHYRKHYQQYLYDNHRRIPPTARGRTEPLIYHLAFARSVGIQRVVTLIFSDTAGEHFDDVRTMERHNRYLARASGILYLLDARQVAPATARLNREAASATTDPLDLIGRVDEIVRSKQSISVNDTIDIPVAVAISKLDLVRSLFQPGSALHVDSPHAGFFDLSDFQTVHDGVRKQLDQWIGPGLENFLNGRISTHGYFGVSALGHSPDADGHFNEPLAPFRVEDPLLWLLYKLKVIGGKTAR